MATENKNSMPDEQPGQTTEKYSDTYPIIEELDAESWSDSHKKILKKIEGAENGNKFYRAISGECELPTSDQCECRIAEFIDWFGKEVVGVKLDKRKACIIKVIRSTSLSDGSSDTWKNDELANKRLSEIYEDVLERNFSERNVSESKSANKEPDDFKPSDISQRHSTSENRPNKSYGTAMSDGETMKNLLGK